MPDETKISGVVIGTVLAALGVAVGIGAWLWPDPLHGDSASNSSPATVAPTVLPAPSSSVSPSVTASSSYPLPTAVASAPQGYETFEQLATDTDSSVPIVCYDTDPARPLSFTPGSAGIVFASAASVVKEVPCLTYHNGLIDSRVQVEAEDSDAPPPTDACNGTGNQYEGSVFVVVMAQPSKYLMLCGIEFGAPTTGYY